MSTHRYKMLPGISGMLLTFVLGSGAHASPYAETQNPIVLVPGAFAFDTVFGVDYWYGIADEMRKAGAKVYVVNLSSLALNEDRAEELLRDVQNILAITGKQKVNLIAHSQGAPAARIVASTSDLVASVTSVHGMNEGTPFAPGIQKSIPPGTLLNTMLVGMFNLIFDGVEFFSAAPADGDYNSPPRGQQSAEHLLYAANPANFPAFNARFPEGMPSVQCRDINKGYNGHRGGGAPVVDGVHYYSWGGTVPVTKWYDPIDALLVPATAAFIPNVSSLVWDGLVPGCGMALGKLIRGDYRANHYDAVNHALGIVPRGLDVPTIYVVHANRLKNDGL